MKHERGFRIFLAFAILALISLLAGRFSFRIDLTADRRYTLSPITRDCLSSLDSAVTLTWYRSSVLERLTPASRTIADFLEEYRAASGGKFEYRIVDPGLAKNRVSPESVGLVARQIDQQGDGTTVTLNLYSGFLVEHGGGSRTIPFLVDPDRFEYDLTRLILDLAGRSGGKTGMAVVYGTENGKTDYPYVEPWLSYSGFEPWTPGLPLGDLDPSVPLIVIGSTAIDEQSAEGIRTFLDSGGSAAFFVSGNTVQTQGNWTATAKKGDFLIPVLAESGFAVEPGLDLDISNYRITMPALDNSRYEYINYPFWVTSLSRNIDRTHPLMAGVRSLQFFWPSPLSLVPGPGTAPELTGLLRTSDSSGVMREPFDTDPFGKQRVPSGEGGERPFLVASGSGRGRILVVPDEYMVGNMIEYTASEGNLDFLVNCAEWISGRENLLSLKKVSAPVVDIDEGQLASGLRSARMVNLAIVPAILIASYSAFVAFRRRR